MKANELRIGNLLHYGDRIAEVSSIYRTHFNCEEHLTRVQFGNSLQANFKPIPITEEWLVKFGFEFWCDELGVKAYYKVYGVEYLCIATNGFYQLRSGLKTNDACWRLGNNYPFIKYVHQLQNIVYDLTNTELTWNQSANS